MASNNYEKIKASLANTTIIDRPISGELKNSFMEYAMSVIIARALPDARDGFKPVHRRVLYAAYGLGMTSDKPHKKSARLVGEVIGKYHPHGDIAVYETMVRLAQDFSMRYPLIDGHGNFGSIDGDSAAAMRYTEARMSKICDEILADLTKNTVDFVDNYDGSEQEPVVLPALIPNLLANGSSGIAVGMATNIPPHNLSELIDGVICLIKNPNVTIDELSQIVKGPDFPTGADIIGGDGIRDYFNTGRGSVTIRSHAQIEKEEDRSRIIVTAIPYMVNKTALIEKIVELVKDEQITGISDLRDETSREGIRIVIELKRGVIPEVLLNHLYKATQLQVNFSVNMLALSNNEPVLLNLKSALEIFLSHQLDVLLRKTKFDLKKATERGHILKGLYKATTNIDRVIQIIRESNDNESIIKQFKTEFDLDEIQSKAILDMRLKTLSGIERNKIKEELDTTLKLIEDLNEIIASKAKQDEIIIAQLEAIKQRYGDARKTRIFADAQADIDYEDLIPKEDVIISLSSNGYMKRIPVDSYKIQHRGGVGVIGMQTHNNDDVAKIVAVNTHTDLLIFTDFGKVYRIRAHQVPIGTRYSKGIPAINFIGVEKGERVVSILPMEEYDDSFLLFATKNGLIKKTSIKEFIRINANGKRAISLLENDELFDVIKIFDKDEIFISGSNGKLVRFNSIAIRPSGRSSQGVIGIRFELDNEKVVGLSCSSHGKYVLSVGAKGYGKLTDFELYRMTNRGAKGVTTLKVTEKTGDLVCSKLVHGDENILIITSSGKIIRFNIKEISETNRSAMGVKLINLNGKERIQSISIFEVSDEAEADDSQISVTNTTDGVNN